jgi:hypothetical protein
MTLRWRYEIHTKDVGRGSRETFGSVATVAEIAAIVKGHPEKIVRLFAPLDESREEREALAKLNVERLFP